MRASTGYPASKIIGDLFATKEIAVLGHEQRCLPCKKWADEGHVKSGNHISIIGHKSDIELAELFRQAKEWHAETYEADDGADGGEADADEATTIAMKRARLMAKVPEAPATETPVPKLPGECRGPKPQVPPKSLAKRPGTTLGVTAKRQSGAGATAATAAPKSTQQKQASSASSSTKSYLFGVPMKTNGMPCVSLMDERLGGSERDLYYTSYVQGHGNLLRKASKYKSLAKGARMAAAIVREVLDRHECE